MSFRHLTSVLLLSFVFAAPAPLRAQSGAIANGAVGVVAADGSTDFVVSGGIGYRFNRVLGFGLEFTHLPQLEPRGAYAFYSFGMCCSMVGDDDDFDGHATIFTTNVRLEVPTTMRRVIPFVVGGGGLAAVTERFPVYYAVPLAQELAALGRNAPVPTILPGPQNFSSTTLAMALTLGGGASVLVTDHVAVDADLRVLKLLANDGRTAGRFQVGASYRF